MKEKYDTLMPKFEESLTYKIQYYVKNFIITVGIFKTIGFVSCISLSLILLKGLSLLQPAYTDKLLSLGEYLSCVFSCGACLLVIALYEYYYLDLIVKWCLKK
jgi:hypothetical protein